MATPQVVRLLRSKAAAQKKECPPVERSMSDELLSPRSRPKIAVRSASDELLSPRSQEELDERASMTNSDDVVSTGQQPVELRSTSLSGPLPTAKPAKVAPAPNNTTRLAKTWLSKVTAVSISSGMWFCF
jgi:hypothetical protein